MLALEDSRWADLSHAYGSAENIPALLRDLEPFPAEPDSDSEPYVSLWGSLCHQGDVYSASYAAVPHLCRVVGSAPERAPWTLLLLVASIEIARRHGRGPEVPPDLEPAYFTALAQIPSLAGAVAVQAWDHSYCAAALAAIAASKGHADYAEAILELDPDECAEFLKWKYREAGTASTSPSPEQATTPRARPWWKRW